MKIWSCKIGETMSGQVPEGGDAPLRVAVEKAYKELTGEDNNFCFSGWGAVLDPFEKDIVEGHDRPHDPFTIEVKQSEISKLWTWAVIGGLDNPVIASDGHIEEATCRRELDMVRRAFLQEALVL